jgi:hypothetical protein
LSKTIDGEREGEYYSVSISAPSSNSDYVFYVGNHSGVSFYVAADGTMYAGKARISGSISVTDGGSVGDFEISGGVLSATDSWRNTVEISAAGVTGRKWSDSAGGAEEYFSNWFSVAQAGQLGSVASLLSGMVDYYTELINLAKNYSKIASKCGF